MEQQLRELVQSLTQLEKYKDIKPQIAKKSDTIRQAAVIVHQDSTLLLSELVHVDKFAVLIALLAVQLEHVPETAHNHFLRLAVTAFMSSDDTTIVQYFHAEVAAISHFITDLSCHTKKAHIIIASLLHICQYVSRKPTELTSIHSDVLQAVIAAKHYSVGHTFLLHCTEITEIDPSYTSLDTKHFLSYYYYAALVYIARQRYADAAAMLDMAIITPASVISLIAIQCFKAAILVSLIEHGKTSAAPIITNLNAHPQVAPYISLAQAFLTGDLSKLLSTIHNHAAALEVDHYSGLAMQTVAALRRRKLRQLSCTYRKLSLVDVARILELDTPAEACACIEKLVMHGTIYAGIDEVSGIVTFTEAKDSTNHLRLSMEQLRQKLALTCSMSERLRILQAEMYTSQAYLVKSLTSASSGGDASVMRGVMDDYDFMDCVAEEK